MKKSDVKMVPSISRFNPLLIVTLIFGGIVLFVFFLFFLLIISFFFAGDVPLQGNVAVISLKGEISVDGFPSYLNQGVSSHKVVSLIEKAEKDGMQAIIFEINSPGGSAVASYEIADAIARAQEKNITTVAVIHELGASGAYWIASATDHIIANELSLTGSIGVISSYLQFEGLLERYNVTYQRLVAGELKDAGSPFKDLTPFEREKLQQKLGIIHQVFIQQVAKNRDLPIENVQQIADGFVYLGAEAVELDLVDQLGGMEEAKAYLEEQLGEEVETVEYKPTDSFLSFFSEVYAQRGFFTGLGIGTALTSQASGVPETAI